MVDMLAFAKILKNTGETSGFTREDFHAEIQKRAEGTRRPGQSSAQAYASYLNTESGRILHDAYKRAPAAPPQAPQDLAPRNTKPSPGPASEEMAALARKLSRERKISYAQAFSRLFTDAAYAELAGRVREEERQATAAVRDQRAPISRAQEELERDFRLGRSPGSERL
jgi:hypothetical protein